MTKILNTSQIKALDAYTIEHEPIASIDLMERACTAFVDWFISRFGVSESVLIVCGTGNNGGDGLGIARLLSLKGYQVNVIIIRGHPPESSDFTKNYKRLPHKVVELKILDSASPSLPESKIIIDALFGSGLTRSLEGPYVKVVEEINKARAIRVAVDIPSGLFADEHTSGTAVQSDYTLTFQLPKLAFLLPENYQYVGEWSCADIGLSASCINQSKCNNFFVDETSIKRIIRPRKKFNHKGDFGHALLVAGSQGKMGANILATRAALRAGSGLLTSVVPKCGYSVLQSSVPEAMVLVDPDENMLTHVPDLNKFTTIGIGPGIGTDKRTAEFLSALLSYLNKPCVLDADALNILAEHRDLQNLIPVNSVLTPHPGEFRRLAGDWKNDFDRLEKQRALSVKLKAIIVLKGAYSSIAIPDGTVYFNSTGNPAMATGGSGDVLTGILTALLAQGYEPNDAAILGVYLHGLAGDLATANKVTIIASDIIEQIPFAWHALAS